MIVEVFYNPRAGKDADKKLNRLQEWYPDAQLNLRDVTLLEDAQLRDYAANCDCVIIAGGDGTLQHFVNAMEVEELSCSVLFYPIGSGNDFAKDVGYASECEPFDIKKAMSRLPVLTVNGNKRRFINGAGIGLDGYVCKEGNLQHEKTGKPVNYILVAIKGLLFGFKPVNAKVTVDGVTKEYHRVWLAPTMLGRYFGGGMMVAPQQMRGNAQGTLSSVVYHNAGALFTMYVFPSIFKGGHVKYKKIVEIREGHEVTVEFDRPCVMQVDGEIIDDVQRYSVHSMR